MSKEFDEYVLKCLTMLHTQQNEMVRRLEHQDKQIDSLNSWLATLLERTDPVVTKVN